MLLHYQLEFRLFKTARHILLNRLPDNLVFPSDNWIFPP